jgi:PleD family two-component response regulator
MALAAKVLVADVPEMDEKVRECLPGHELTFVRTMFEAMRALRHDGFQLVVIGLRFDESRMLELLQYVRGLPVYRDVPVICVHGEQLTLSDAVIRNIDVAVRALGGVAFLDLSAGLHHWQDCRFLDRVAGESGASLRPS